MTAIEAIKEHNSSLNIEENRIHDKAREALSQFQKNRGVWITSNCQYLNKNGIHFYGIRKIHQMLSSTSIEATIETTRNIYLDLRSHVLQYMNVHQDTDVIQVVGDSQPFSLEGTQQAKLFFEEQIPSEAVIQYGYTGTAEKDGSRCVNAALTDMINNREFHHRVIANIVGYHSLLVLSKSNGHEPSLHHYVMVYGDDESSRESGTLFGDDVTTSDYFCNRLLLLEGGAQSFRQACNALLLNQKITVLSGLRDKAKEHHQDTDGELTSYFSASKLLLDVIGFMNARGTSFTKIDLENWYQEYFGKGKCYIVNPSRADFLTKQKLLDEAWTIFMNHKLYQKIGDLIEFKQI